MPAIINSLFHHHYSQRLQGLNGKNSKPDHHFAVHSHLLEVSRPHHTHRSKRAPVLPLHICERQRVFYAIADMESGSERKAKDGKLQKKIARYIA